MHSSHVLLMRDSGAGLTSRPLEFMPQVLGEAPLLPTAASSIPQSAIRIFKSFPSRKRGQVLPLSLVGLPVEVWIWVFAGMTEQAHRPLWSTRLMRPLRSDQVIQ